MAVRIIIGVVVVLALSAWVFYIDNKGDKSADDADDEKKEEAE